MAGDEVARLMYYGVLLVVIGGAMLFEFSGRGGRALRQLLLWVVIFAAVFIAADMWMERGNPRQQVFEGGRIEIPISRDGHFHLTAQLNGTEVRMIVDTGASSIALGPSDARRIGLDVDNLAYMGTAMTANGAVRTAPVVIGEFAIGDIIDRNVGAHVIDGGLQTSLLGMSYLRRFARVSFEGNLMVLER